MREAEPRSEELLEGKVALVSGGANGIGRAIVAEFLHEGARVAFFDIDEANIKETLDELSASDRLVGYRVDVRDEAAIVDALADIEARLGVVDTLVNNAGIDPPHAALDFPQEQLQEIVSTNLVGAAVMTQIVGARMIEAGVRGSITFITSVHTAQAFPGGFAYDASKHGLVGMMRVAALEWAPHGIRVNAVAPGAIYPTGLTEGLTEEQQLALSQRIPLGRLGTPQDVAHVVAFVASDKAGYVTGAEWRVDGGLAIKTPLFE